MALPTRLNHVRRLFTTANSVSRAIHQQQTRAMTIIATTKKAEDTTTTSYPAPGVISAQREVLFEILQSRLYWLNPESIVNYTEDEMARAEAQFRIHEQKITSDIINLLPEEERAEASAALIPTNPRQRMQSLQGKTLKTAFPYLFD